MIKKIKLLKENIGKLLHDIEVGKDLINGNKRPLTNW